MINLRLLIRDESPAIISIFGVRAPDSPIPNLRPLPQGEFELFPEQAPRGETLTKARLQHAIPEVVAHCAIPELVGAFPGCDDIFGQSALSRR